uniref:Uncharacterized protein n=1 Tax=Zea mays TaxID=4577 RepID=C4J6T1_MAIZE|nr:unknown [Zea mays]
MAGPGSCPFTAVMTRGGWQSWLTERFPTLKVCSTIEASATQQQASTNKATLGPRGKASGDNQGRGAMPSPPELASNDDGQRHTEQLKIWLMISRSYAR